MCGASLPSPCATSRSAWRSRRCWRCAAGVHQGLGAFEVPALVGLPGSHPCAHQHDLRPADPQHAAGIGSAAAFGVLLLIVMAILLQFYGRLSAQAHRYPHCHRQGLPAARDPPRPLALSVTILVGLIPFVVVLIPLATIIWAALLPFYQPFNFAALSRLGFDNFHQFDLARGRDAMLNTPDPRGGDRLRRDRPLLPLPAGASRGASPAGAGSTHWRPCRWCFPASCSGSPGCRSSSTAPTSTGRCCRSSSSLRSPISLTVCAMRSSASSRSIPNSKRPRPLPARATPGPSSIVLPLLVPALISCWLFIFLLAVRAMSLVLLLTGPTRRWLRCRCSTHGTMAWSASWLRSDACGPPS